MHLFSYSSKLCHLPLLPYSKLHVGTRKGYLQTPMEELGRRGDCEVNTSDMAEAAQKGLYPPKLNKTLLLEIIV